MRVLITGGTGFIGQHLTAGALARGWRTAVLTRDPGSTSSQVLAGRGAELVLGDITERATLRGALDVLDPELIFHNAGWYELGIAQRERRRMWQVNVEGVENVLGVAAECEVPKVVYTSSTTALGDTGGETVDERFERRAPPLSFYEQTKSEAHGLARRHQQAGEPVVLACPAQAVGLHDHSPFGHFARLYLRGLLPVSWAPQGAFTFAHVEDVAEGLLLCGERGQPGEVYFLAGHGMTTADMLRTWGHAIQRRPPRIWLPRALAMGVGAVSAPVLRFLGMPAFLSTEVVRNSYASFRFSSRKAEADLGVRFRSAADAWEQTLLDMKTRVR